MAYFCHAVGTGQRAAVLHLVETGRDSEDSAGLHLSPSCSKMSENTTL